MQDTSDLELLQQYHRQGTEAAFATLVARHVNLVYSVALRQVRNAAPAEEITQAVFILLARKADQLSPPTVLAGWLHETTRLTALAFLRGERRRQAREQEAYMQSTQTESAEATAWPQLAPLLDEALARLGKKDRDAVLLRFFQEQNLAAVAAALQVSEPAAQRRVHRAVEKLRKFFAKRGMALSGVALAGAISANSVQAAPVGLAKAVTAIAVAKGAAASTSTLTLIKGTLKIMAWTKMKTAVVVGVAAILATGTATVVVKEVINNRPGYYKGKPLIEWLKNLDDQHPGSANDEAAAAVRHIGTNGLPTIINLLPLNNPMHHSAVLACQELGAGAKSAIPALMKLLNDGYANGYVGVAMGRIGEEAIVPLTTALTNENDMVRAEVAHGLGGMPIYSGNRNIEMSDTIPALITCLTDKSSFVRALAANSLGGIKNDPSTVVPELIKSLNDSDKWTRWNSCLALGQFGEQAKSAIPALLAKLNSDARSTAAIALIQIEPDNEEQINSLMPVLIENIEGIGGTNVNYRSTTADALGSIGKSAIPAVPALLRAAQVTKGYEQQRIVIALKQIDPQAAVNAGLK